MADTINHLDGEASETEQDEDFFLMANLRPDFTGLPFVVWIFERGNARHDVRVKVADGPRVPPFKASVGLRPAVEVKQGELSGEELRVLTVWIELNRDVLIRYWDQEIDTPTALAGLQRVG